MFAKFFNHLALARSYFHLNLNAQMEYRGAFLAQLIAMFINNVFWLTFWFVFFSRFPVLTGWQMSDVVTMWAIAASGIGIAHIFCGNALFLSAIITKGQLDAWMLCPRALLPHIVLGKMSATACGDALFGFVAYIALVHPDLSHIVLFTFLAIAAAILFAGFSILTGSLAFFVGNAEAVSEQWLFALITFSTYPASLFEGNFKLLLLTVIPAMFISYFPIITLR